MMAITRVSLHPVSTDGFSRPGLALPVPGVFLGGLRMAFSVDLS